MADDIGTGDITCYGAKLINTPNIDKLASQETRFDRYYTAGAVCAPTRYSVLTGRYPFRTKELRAGRQSPWDYLFIEENRMTLGSLCKQKGYQTAAIGKWHLGYGTEEELDYSGPLKPGPLEIGFDYHWGVPRNHNDRIRAFVENHKLYGLDPNSEYKPATRTERVQGLLHERVDDRVDSTLTAKVLEFIRTNKDGPFFVYFTPCAAHTHVTPNVRFRGTSKAGQYGDYVQELDHHVGEIMNLLDELELAEQPRRSVALHSSRARSFVDGDWKLVDYSYRVNKPEDKYELYNLSEDPAESVDLASSNPEQLNNMRVKLKQIVEADRSR